MKKRQLSVEVMETAALVKPLLAGREPIVQSAILAELTGILLAGYSVPGEPHQTEALRREIFKAHCDLVWELCEVNAKMMGTDR